MGGRRRFKVSSTHHIHGKITEVKASTLGGTSGPTFSIDVPNDEDNPHNVVHSVWFPKFNDLPDLAKKFHGLARQFEDIYSEYMAAQLPQADLAALEVGWQEEAEGDGCPENHGQGQGPCCPSPEEEAEAHLEAADAQRDAFEDR